MFKKIGKKLLVTSMCATLVVGSALTVYAAENSCTHSNYIVESEWDAYTDIGADGHWYGVWQERYCMDCGAYYDVRVEWDRQGHSHATNGVCVDCGNYDPEKDIRDEENATK